MSCSITDIKLDNISGVSIAPAFENNWAGRDFTIKCGGGTVNGLFSMNQLERRANELFKEAKNMDDSFEKFKVFRSLNQFVVTLDKAEDEGIALYENDDKIGCFFRLITTLFCRLFDLCSPSHKEYQVKLKGKIDAEITRLENMPKSAATETLVTLRQLKYKFTPQPVQYTGPLITLAGFQALLQKHETDLSKVGKGDGVPLSKLKDAFSNNNMLQIVMTLINKQDQKAQALALKELTQAFSRPDQAIHDRTIKRVYDRFIFSNLDLKGQFNAIATSSPDAEVDVLCSKIADLLNTSKGNDVPGAPSYGKIVYWISEESKVGDLKNPRPNPLPVTFGRYTEEKEFSGCYKGIKSATDEHQAAVELYLSPEEIKYMLQTFGCIDLS